MFKLWRKSLARAASRNYCHWRERATCTSTNKLLDLKHRCPLPSSPPYTCCFHSRNIAKNGRVMYSSATSSSGQIQTASTAQSASQATPSALYIKSTDNYNVAVVGLDLDLDKRLSNVTELEDNLRARNMHREIRGYVLLAEYNVLKNLIKRKKELEEEKENVVRKMRNILNAKQSEELAKEKAKLVKRGKEIREALKQVQKEYVDVEEEVITTGLLLPTELHPDTPPKDEVIKQTSKIPTFHTKIRSHVELGEKTKTLTRSAISPTAYYLHGELAKLELDLIHDTCNTCRQAGMQQFSCPDLIKSVVVEASGKEFTNPKKVFTLALRAVDAEAFQKRTGKADPSEMDKWDITYHLCGGASSMAFAAYLTKMNISSDDLPMKAFSVSRHYSPDTQTGGDKLGLLAAYQTNRVQVFGAAKDADEAYNLYNEYKDKLWELYQQMQIPVRLVHVGSDRLLHSEAIRTEVQVWIPSQNTYHKIGHVSMWNDFISRRLMIKHSKNIDRYQQDNFVHMVHGTFLESPAVIAALMENHQTQEKKAGFNIPKEVIMNKQLPSPNS